MADIAEEIITTEPQLAACCAYLATQPMLGFDTEFVGEDTYIPRLCLIQVATPERLFLIDPFSVGPLDAFWKLLHDPDRVAIVHAGREEVRLCRVASGQAPANLFDLQLAAGLVGMTYPMGHGGLVNELLKVRLSKGETLTEWRRRPLTADQIRYAFDDVRFLLRLYDKLNAKLTKRGRAEWGREEFARLASATDPDEQATEERWRKLKGAGSLDRKKLAVVRALHAWREERAADLNRPPRTIVRDDLLVEIARRTPAKSRDLQVIRGLAHRDLDAIFDVIQAARKLPPEEWPAAMDRIDDPPQVNLVSNILIAVLGDICADDAIAANLAASNNDVRTLVRSHLHGEALSEDIPLAQGWRAAHLLPKLRAVLEGKVVIRVRDIRKDAPLDYADAESVKAPPATDE